MYAPCGAIAMLFPPNMLLPLNNSPNLHATPQHRLEQVYSGWLKWKPALSPPIFDGFFREIGTHRRGSCLVLTQETVNWETALIHVLFFTSLFFTAPCLPAGYSSLILLTLAAGLTMHKDLRLPGSVETRLCR